MEKPQIGDTVIIKGVIMSFSSGGAHMHISTPHNSALGTVMISTSRITEIVPKPWTPEVGESVMCDGRKYMFLGTFGTLTNGKPEWAILGYIAGIPIIRDYSRISRYVYD